MKWQTPDDVPQGTVCRPLFIPSSEQWLAIVTGAIADLTNPLHWEQVGALTPLECAERSALLLQQYIDGICGGNGEGVDVRQNPQNDCELQKNDGSGWVTFADLSLCKPLYRLNGAGQLEVSANGGASYTPVASAPQSVFPRDASETDARCLASANAAFVVQRVYEEFVDLYNSGIEPMLVIAGVISAIAVFVFYAPALPVVIEFFTLVWRVMEHLTDADFTTEVFDTLTEILYCSADDVTGDITFDHAEVMSELQKREDVLVPIYLVLRGLVGAIGEAGLNVAGGTTGISSWDCGNYNCCEETTERVTTKAGVDTAKWGVLEGNVGADWLGSGAGRQITPIGWTRRLDVYIKIDPTRRLEKVTVRHDQSGSVAAAMVGFPYAGEGMMLVQRNWNGYVGSRTDEFDVNPAYQTGQDWLRLQFSNTNSVQNQNYYALLYWVDLTYGC